MSDANQDATKSGSAAAAGSPANPPVAKTPAADAAASTAAAAGSSNTASAANVPPPKPTDKTPPNSLPSDVKTPADQSKTPDNGNQKPTPSSESAPGGKPGIFPSVTGAVGTPTAGDPADATASGGSTIATGAENAGATGSSTTNKNTAIGDDAQAPGAQGAVDPNSPDGPNATNDPAVQGKPSDPVPTGEGKRITAPLDSQAAQDQAAQKHDDSAKKLNEGAASTQNRANGERAAQSGAERNEAVSKPPRVRVSTIAKTNPLLLDQAIEEAQAAHGEGTVILPESYSQVQIPEDSAQRRREAIGRIAGAHPDTIPTPGRTRVPPNSGSEPEDQDTAPVTGEAPVGGNVLPEEQARAIDKRHVAASQRKDMGDPAGTGVERAEKPVP